MSSSRLLQNKWKHTVEVSPTSHITSWQHCTWDLTYNDVLTGDLHKALFWFPSSLLASYGCCFLIQTGYISGWRFAPSGAIHNKVSRGLPIHLLWPKLAAHFEIALTHQYWRNQAVTNTRVNRFCNGHGLRCRGVHNTMKAHSSFTPIYTHTHWQPCWLTLTHDALV